MIDTSSGLGTTVIRRTIHEEDDVLPPGVCKLLADGLTQVRQEHLHDVLVSVALGQRQPDVALRGDCNYHVDPVAHLAFRHAVVSSLGHPAPPPEVTLRDPGLVDVHDVLALAVDLEHLLGVQ